jgi:mono/diheme cytochrome c family protein
MERSTSTSAAYSAHGREAAASDDRSRPVRPGYVFRLAAMRLRLVALCVLLGAVAFLAAGCLDGSSESATPDQVVGTVATTPTTTTGGNANLPALKLKGDAAAGKTVFQSAGCGSCHTLKDAGSNGTVGPNLDERKPPFQLAVERVTLGKSPMPSFKGQLKDQQIADVAQYVSTVAGH